MHLHRSAPAAFLFWMFLFGLAASASGTAFYVSPNGDDSWSGITSEKSIFGTNGPFATLERARDAIRELKKSGRYPARGGVTVFIREGVYSLSRTFQLSAEDSGSLESPVSYRAYRNETVRLLGGKALENLEPVRDREVLKRLPAASRSRVLSASVPRSAFGDSAPKRSYGFGRPIIPADVELFCDGRPMVPARWPNEGWATVVRVSSERGKTAIHYDGDRPGAWTEASDINLHVYRPEEGKDCIDPLSAINAPGRSLIPAETTFEYRAGDRWYAAHILEELDTPGEWYLDRGTGTIYLWPYVPDGEITVSLLEKPVISINGAQHIIFRGLTVECTRGNGITIAGGARNLIAGCTIRNVGNIGVRLMDGVRNGVNGCDILYTGEGGILIEGGNRKALSPSGNFAINNDISSSARRVLMHRPAIQINGVGNLVSRNRIRHVPHAAVMLTGNEHVVEYNDIFDVCRESADLGAIYLGRDWTHRGTVVRFNRIRDIEDHPSAVAVHLGEFTSGITLFGNFFVRTGSGVAIDGGTNNTIENNVFVECSPAVRFSVRGPSEARHRFEALDRLSSVDYRKPPFSTRYPELVSIKADRFTNPGGNRLVRNVLTGENLVSVPEGISEDTIETSGNFTGTDPGFLASSGDNFQIPQDAPIYRAGFQYIPIEEIGLKLDLYRTTIPGSSSPAPQTGE